jgi:ABC-type amino acid transport substrate-binding protein
MAPYPSRTVVWACLIVAMAVAPAPADLSQIKSDGVLRVLVNPDLKRPEFFSIRPGTPPGFDQEVVEGFARLHRLRVEIRAVDGWGALIPALLDRKGDVIAGRFTVTEARRKLIEFTHEVFPYRLVVMTRKPHRLVLSLDELKGEKVGTTRGSNMAEALDAAGIAANRDDTIPTGGYPEALKAGRITAAAWGVESAIASQREDPEIQLGMFLGPPGSLAYGVRKEDVELRRALDAYIDNMRKTPTWSRLVIKYFGEAAPDILKKARAE